MGSNDRRYQNKQNPQQFLTPFQWLRFLRNNDFLLSTLNQFRWGNTIECQCPNFFPEKLLMVDYLFRLIPLSSFLLCFLVFLCTLMNFLKLQYIWKAKFKLISLKFWIPQPCIVACSVTLKYEYNYCKTIQNKRGSLAQLKDTVSIASEVLWVRVCPSCIHPLGGQELTPSLTNQQHTWPHHFVFTPQLLWFFHFLV